MLAWTMSQRRRCRDRQRGNSLLLAMIVLSALATLGSLTVVSVQGSLKASTHDRSHTVAMLAAESGAVVAMEYLRNTYDGVEHWSEYVNADGTPFLISNAAGEMPSNGALPETANNVLSADQNASYTVVLLNNRNDPSPVGGPIDGDGQVIIQSTGRGPQGALAIVEWEVRFDDTVPATANLPPALPQREGGLILVSWRVVL